MGQARGGRGPWLGLALAGWLLALGFVGVCVLLPVGLVAAPLVWSLVVGVSAAGTTGSLARWRREGLRAAVPGLAASGALQLSAWVAALGVLELAFWNADLWTSCSMASVVVPLSWPSRAFAWLLAGALWWGGLLILAWARGWLRWAGPVALVAAVALLPGNYRGLVYRMCQDQLVVQDLSSGLLGWEPEIRLEQDPNGPVDPLMPDTLPLSVGVGEPVCHLARGRRLVLYRVGLPPRVVTSPLLRRWRATQDGVASVFRQSDGSERVVWVCGQGAPRALFEGLAAEQAQEDGLTVDSLVEMPSTDGSTRYEALLR